MSTKLTTIDDDEIQLRPLAQVLVKAQQWVNLSVVELMQQRGHQQLTVAQLVFLANLDCGATHASAVARRMGVTRQAVYRSTRELQSLDILDLEDDLERRNQKIIQITPHGRAVIDDAKACIAAVEDELAARLGADDFERLQSVLHADWGSPIGMD